MTVIKPLAHIGHWDGFLDEWDRNITEQGAVGLLFAGVDLPLKKEDVQSLEERITFYLEAAKHISDVVAEKAQQMLVHRWLPRTYALQTQLTNNIKGPYAWATPLALHLPLLEFLQRGPSEGLNRPPYPRVVAEYLEEFMTQWLFHGYSDDPRHREVGNLLARAMLHWGIGHRLATVVLHLHYGRVVPGYIFEDFRAQIKAFLDERGVNIASTLITVDYHKELTDLRGELWHQVNNRAILAYLHLDYLMRTSVALEMTQ